MAIALDCPAAAKTAVVVVKRQSNAAVSEVQMTIGIMLIHLSP